ncbi:nuclear transport factor 2 family protein [Chitinophaga pendula]|nr:nuclear transport factor 2 family protein [Chitinophaga pendula]
MNTYIEGLRNGNTALLQSVFHKDAIMYGYWGQQLIEGAIENLYISVSKAGTAPQIRSHLTVLHKTATTAIVRNEVEANATMDSFTEYHSLIKIAGEWKIVTKLFHKYDK